ncbi:c-type cytochrome domain-containing protein [Shivajiella indica]|uniref:C-type cytochrome domain-containing protein n=1 Tax=Shivajiella indica TaxID=872115 RepID=A0ABW5BA64_9BACT
MDFIFSLLGRFHPLLVHLPIGFLLIGFLFLFHPKKQNESLFPAVKLAFLWGNMAAVLSVLSGVMLYNQEGYTFESVRWHLIFGGLTTVSSIGFYFYLKDHEILESSKTKLLGTVLMLLLILTGHFGGSLTHGETYLTEVLPKGIQSLIGYQDKTNEEGLSLKRENWEESLLYKDVVHPILAQNCNSCHNDKNKKGGLILSSFESILVGGKNGPIIHPEELSESPIIQRLLLPKEDKEHMPPKDKRQPSKEEIKLLKKWVELGAPFEISLLEAGIEESILEPFFKGEDVSDFPQVDLPRLSQPQLQAIKERGILVEELSLNSSLLKVSSVNVPDFSDEDWNLLVPVKNYIAVLDLSDTQISDDLLAKIRECDVLTVLKLNRTSIQGVNLSSLMECKNLKKLHLNSSQVTYDMLLKLSGHPLLEIIYAFDTPASRQNTPEREAHSPKIEFGFYDLPSLPSDSKIY